LKESAILGTIRSSSLKRTSSRSTNRIWIRSKTTSPNHTCCSPRATNMSLLERKMPLTVPSDTMAVSRWKEDLRLRDTKAKSTPMAWIQGAIWLHRIDTKNWKT